MELSVWISFLKCYRSCGEKSKQLFWGVALVCSLWNRFIDCQINNFILNMDLNYWCGNYEHRGLFVEAQSTNVLRMFCPQTKVPCIFRNELIKWMYEKFRWLPRNMTCLRHCSVSWQWITFIIQIYSTSYVETAVKNLDILNLGSPNPMFDENRLTIWKKFHGLWYFVQSDGITTSANSFRLDWILVDIEET